MMNQEPPLPQVLDEIVRRLRDALDPLAIYHFGSTLSGTRARHSDVDLLVIVKDSPLSFFERGGIAYRALYGVGVPVDVQVYTKEEFDSRAALPVSFERTVRTKGRLIHAA